jgi:hypothetical protein
VKKEHFDELVESVKQASGIVKNNPVLEKDIERSVVEWAKRRGWWVRKFTSPARRSAPDRIFAYKGRVVFIEFKAHGKKPTPLQAKEHEDMRAAGLDVHVFDDAESAKRRLKEIEDAIEWVPFES